MPDLRKSPLRYSFQKKKYIERMMLEGKGITDPSVEAHLNLFTSIEEDVILREQTKEWRTDNLEYDLRTSELIINKCEDDVYAQHLYAALCNNYFVKNDLWPLLKHQQWHCSWRHAGGIVADIQEKGDYIDWYCSGIRDKDNYTKEEFDNLSTTEQAHILKLNAYVSESTVTDEIRQDLQAIGWLTFTDDSDQL